MSVASFPAYGASQGSDAELQNDLDRISAAARRTSGKELEKVGEELRGKWRARHPQYHAEVMLKLCRELASRDYPRARKQALLRKYAAAGLEDRKRISVESFIGLAECIGTMPLPSTKAGDEWVEQRRADTTIRLEAWKKLKEAIDPRWDPKDGPTLSVRPPVAGLPSGVAPEAIESPTLRAEYQAAIEANKKKAAKYRQQHALRKLQRSFSRRTEAYLVEAYSRPPLKTEELEELLQKYVPDEDAARSRIMQAVRERNERGGRKGD